MNLPFGIDGTGRALRRMLVAIAFATLGVFSPPTLPAQRVALPVGVCTAQGTPAELEVHCPSATVAQLFEALRDATGLRGHYARELADTRMSVTSWRGPLIELLEDALSAFNFVYWTDEGAPSVPNVSIVGLRGAPEPRRQVLEHVEPEADPVEQFQPDQEMAEPPPTRIALPDDEAQTAETPESEGLEDIPATALEEIPATAMEPASAAGNVLLPPTAGATPLEPVPAETWSSEEGPGLNTQH